MLAFSSYIEPKKKKVTISDEDAEERYPKESFKISNKTDQFIDEIPISAPAHQAKEQTIDEFTPKEPEKYKVKPYNFRDFDELLIGFPEEHHNSDLALADRDNALLFGTVTAEELALSNFETEHGTSNRLNRLLRQKETGLSMDEIKDLDTTVDNSVDKQYKEELEEFMKLYRSEYNAATPQEKKFFTKEIQKE